MEYSGSETSAQPGALACLLSPVGSRATKLKARCNPDAAQKPSFLDKSQRIDSSKVPVEMQLASGAAGDNDWHEKPARDSEATAQSIQGSEADLDEARCMCSDLPPCSSRLV
jgi:hypothetical protein